MKVSVGLATWAVGLMLSAVGHSAESPMSGDGASLFGTLLFGIPALLMLLSMFAIWRYPLTTEAHARIVTELEGRRVEPSQ